MIANDINVTGRDNYLLQEALRLTETQTPPTHAELAGALLGAIDLLETAAWPPMSTIEDMRTLLRKKFMGETLSELVAREKRKTFTTIYG